MNPKCFLFIYFVPVVIIKRSLHFYIKFLKREIENILFGVFIQVISSKSKAQFHSTALAQGCQAEQKCLEE